MHLASISPYVYALLLLQSTLSYLFYLQKQNSYLISIQPPALYIVIRNGSPYEVVSRLVLYRITRKCHLWVLRHLISRMVIIIMSTVICGCTAARTRQLFGACRPGGGYYQSTSL